MLPFGSTFRLDRQQPMVADRVPRKTSIALLLADGLNRFQGQRAVGQRHANRLVGSSRATLAVLGSLVKAIARQLTDAVLHNILLRCSGFRGYQVRRLQFYFLSHVIHLMLSFVAPCYSYQYTPTTKKRKLRYNIIENYFILPMHRNSAKRRSPLDLYIGRESMLHRMVALISRWQNSCQRGCSTKRNALQQIVAVRQKLSLYHNLVANLRCKLLARTIDLSI